MSTRLHMHLRSSLRLRLSFSFSDIFGGSKAVRSAFQTNFLELITQQRTFVTTKVRCHAVPFHFSACLHKASSQGGGHQQQRSKKDKSSHSDKSRIFTSPYAKVPACNTPLHEKVLTAVLRTIERNPDRVAFIRAEDSSSRIAFKELHEQVYRVASFLYQRGYGYQDVCCQVLPNCFHYAVFYLGALLVGGVMSGASALCTEFELERQFLDSHSKVVITSDASLSKVLLAVNNCPLVKCVICVHPAGSPTALPSGVVSWDEVINTPVTNLPKHEFSPDDLALLPYSSGTTGMPKGVMLTHKNFTTMMDIVDRHFEDHVVGKLGDSKWDYHNENLLLMLPFYHIYGFGLLNQSLLNGATGIVLTKFDPVVFLEAIQTYKPKILMLVPPILLFLTKHPMTAKYDLSSLEFILTGAAPAGKDLCDEFLRKYQHVRYLTQGYGMTECSMASHLPLLDARDNFTNVGVVASTYEQKIISESGEALRVGELGEICIRGPTIMKGYLGRPEVTAQVLDSEGWLHTGDIGFLDNKGQTHIIDRLKELIKVKGLQVAPTELEDILLSHEKISDAAVIGVPDEKLGEKPRAYVVRTDSNLTEDDVQKFMKEKVSSHKLLTGGVVFVPEIPKSPAGKILRRALRDRVAKEFSIL